MNDNRITRLSASLSMFWVIHELNYMSNEAAIKWASSRQNLSLGFPTKHVSNQSPQVQGLTRKLKFHL